MTSPAQPADQLLERDEHLRALEDSLNEVSVSDGGRLLLLAGEAGVGKTALLRGTRPGW